VRSGASRFLSPGEHRMFSGRIRVVSASSDRSVAPGGDQPDAGDPPEEGPGIIQDELPFG
jgi:hypothetical protein